MSARALNGQLFHGTSASLAAGDKVLPPAVAKAGTPNSSHPGVASRYGTEHDPYVHASASQSESHSWEFAVMTAAKRGGRSAVYRVGTPVDAKRGLERKEVLSQEGFTVHDREDIRPPESVRLKGKSMRYGPNPNGRQGTLPLDWTPKGSSVYSWGMQYGYGDHWNHPTEHSRVQAEKLAAQVEKDAPKHPPMYMGGLKVADSVSEQFQARRQGGQKQPMLPGMRGMK